LLILPSRGILRLVHRQTLKHHLLHSSIMEPNSGQQGEKEVFQVQR